MAQILIIEDDEDVREILSVFIESEFDIQVVESCSGNEAVSQMSKGLRPDCIISDYTMDDGNGDIVYEYLKSWDLKIPFILFSGRDYKEIDNFKNFLKEYDKNSFIAKPFDDEELNQAVIKAIGDSSSHNQDNDYKKVNLARFSNINNMKFSFFILQDDEYSEAIEKDEPQKIQIVNELQEVGIKEFYLKNDDYDSFVKYANLELKKKLKQKKLSSQEKIDVQLSSIESLHECLHGIGFDLDVFDVVNKTMNSMIQSVRGDQRLISYLGKIAKNQSYTYELAAMTCYVSVFMFSKMSWCTRAGLDKLAQAALFMDVGLEDERLVRINNIHSDEFKELSEEDQKLVLDHPMKSFDMIKNITSFPTEVKTLILHHHERPAGEGFPEKMNNKTLAPLSCILIMAHEFSHRICSGPLTKKVLETILEDFEDFYSQHNFKQPYFSFIDTFKASKK